MLHPFRLAMLLVGASVFIASCAPGTPAPTPTPDPCAPANIAAGIESLHALTREFDDASALAANTDLRQLTVPISELERIRTQVEAQQVPACLEKLQGAQLAFMSKTVDTLVAFAGGSADVGTLAQGLKDARGLRDQYNLELAAAMGLPVETQAPTSPP